MRTTKFIAGLVTAGLLGVTPLAVGAPAQATENLTTTTTIEVDRPAVTYGQTISVSGTVIGSDGLSALYGTVTVYQMTPSNPTWTPIGSDTTPGYFSFYPIKPRSNTAYKAVYSGYAAQTTYQDNYAPSESAPLSVGVQRNVSIDRAKKRLTIVGKVKPTYKNKKVIVHRKKGKRWVKFKTVKTNKRSKFLVTLPAPRRGGKIYFRITVPGNNEYLEYREVWYTYTYRTAARTAPRG